VPSYRFSAAIGALRPGVAAARVLPELTDDARTLAIVEASNIAVVRGEARVVIRAASPSASSAWRANSPT
jgi:hypothetical protein